MSIQNAGAIIREARLKAGLTQEQLSEGVCSTLSLSRIENGTAGVSPSTFQALMAHAGAGCEAYPAFASHADFDCFYTLKRVRFFLDSWQLPSACEELDKIEKLEWADNKFYYQEWLLLHCRLQFRSGCGNHLQIYRTALDALHISRPEFDSADFRKLLLSSNEIELCILLAQEALYLKKPDVCLQICTQISSYLSNTHISFFALCRSSFRLLHRRFVKCFTEKHKYTDHHSNHSRHKKNHFCADKCCNNSDQKGN